MHRRRADRRNNPYKFDNIFLPEKNLDFKSFNLSFIHGYNNTPSITDHNAIPKMKFFLEWLEMEGRQV